MYLRKSRKVIAEPTFQLKKGDLVRISFTKQPFQRAYQEQFTTEVFKVVSRLFKQGISMFKLNDLKGDTIHGLFYTAELQKVKNDENNLRFIELILETRKTVKKETVLSGVAWVS